MTEEILTVVTAYLRPDQYQKIKQHAFTRGIQKSEIIRELIDASLLRMEETGERSIAETLDERARRRRRMIEEATDFIDEQMDQRWHRIKAAIREIDSANPTKDSDIVG